MPLSVSMLEKVYPTTIGLNMKGVKIKTLKIINILLFWLNNLAKIIPIKLENITAIIVRVKTICKEL